MIYHIIQYSSCWMYYRKNWNSFAFLSLVNTCLSNEILPGFYAMWRWTISRGCLIDIIWECSSFPSTKNWNASLHAYALSRCLEWSQICWINSLWDFAYPTNCCCRSTEMVVSRAPVCRTLCAQLQRNRWMAWTVDDIIMELPCPDPLNHIWFAPTLI